MSNHDPMRVASAGWRRRTASVVALLAALSALMTNPAAARRHPERDRSWGARHNRDERRLREQRADRERRAAQNARRGRGVPFAYIRAADRQKRR